MIKKQLYYTKNICQMEYSIVSRFVCQMEFSNLNKATPFVHLHVPSGVLHFAAKQSTPDGIFFLYLWSTPDGIFFLYLWSTPDCKFFHYMWSTPDLKYFSIHLKEFFLPDGHNNCQMKYSRWQIFLPVRSTMDGKHIPCQSFQQRPCRLLVGRNI